MTRDDLWPMIRTQRAALADDLGPLDGDAWATASLCQGWTVEDVVAHLTAAASIGRFRWLASMAGARFDPAIHNQRRLVEHRGDTPTATLQRFRAIVDSTTAASGHTPGWLGEVIVHAADIRRPLGIQDTTPVEVVTPVAQFYASRDFAVPSASAIAGLRLEAVDGPFASGDGPLVRGSTHALTLAMAGRRASLDELTGPGVAILASRGPASPA